MMGFNVSLLGKWCWRLFVVSVGFRYKVLVAKYGEEDGSMKGEVSYIGVVERFVKY
jgi:hypothetical protein